MPYTRVAAFDLSLTGTGWAGYDVVSKKISYALCPVFHKDEQPLFDQRRFQHVLKFVKARVDPYTLAIVEGFSFGSKGNSLYELAGLGHLIRYYFYQQCIPFLIVDPGRLKQFVAGKGNAPKSVMIKAVYQRFDLDVNDDNLADAIGLAHIGMSLTGAYAATNDAQRTVVANLKAGCRHLFPQEAA